MSHIENIVAPASKVNSVIPATNAVALHPSSYSAPGVSGPVAKWHVKIVQTIQAAAATVPGRSSGSGTQRMSSMMGAYNAVEANAQATSVGSAQSCPSPMNTQTYSSPNIHADTSNPPRRNHQGGLPKDTGSADGVSSAPNSRRRQ